MLRLALGGAKSHKHEAWPPLQLSGTQDPLASTKFVSVAFLAPTSDFHVVINKHFSVRHKNNVALTEPSAESGSEFTEYGDSFNGTLFVEGNFSGPYLEPGQVKDHHSVNRSINREYSFGLVFGVGTFILLLVGLLGILILKCKSKHPTNLRWHLCLNCSRVPETSITADANRKQCHHFWSRHFHIIPEEAVQISEKVGENHLGPVYVGVAKDNVLFGGRLSLKHGKALSELKSDYTNIVRCCFKPTLTSALIDSTQDAFVPLGITLHNELCGNYSPESTTRKVTNEDHVLVQSLQKTEFCQKEENFGTSMQNSDAATDRRKLIQYLRMIRELRHCRVVQFYGIWLQQCGTNSVPFLVTEWLPAGNLDSYIKHVLGQYESEDLSNPAMQDLYQHNTLLAPSQVLAMLVDISIGLEYLHDRGYAYGVSS
ncbi:hypothetical protein CLF_107790 [Clonorchis sinensis]|uniref:Protein kinase domain-containing protein n=1 Tax=Clonorchis sinensis TaxID=79923 RepID=G7YR03_CLOSI|nr:hypothetical protein CLF_107790 [Clonorchis sinensis]